MTKQIYDHREVVQYTCPAGTVSRSCGRLGVWSSNPVQCKFVLGKIKRICVILFLHER